MSKILFTGGGTAGHCTPNLALVPYLESVFPEICYIGSRNGVEKDLVGKSGIPYYAIPTVRLVRKPTPKNLAVPFRLLRAVCAAKKILRKENPSVVFSKGGYVSLPVAIAAKELGIPVVTHESDFSLGLANKIAAKFSDFLLTSFEQTAQDLPNARYVGSPLRRELFLPYDEASIRKKYRLKGNLPLLLVTGGSSGSEALNRAVEGCLDELTKRFEIVHLYGKGKSCAAERDGYRPVPFAENVAELFRITDYALSRAGANTLFELTALGIPTLAVPLPKGNSRGDQIENAKYFHDNRLIDLLFEEELSSASLPDALQKLVAHGRTLKENCRKKDFRRANKLIVGYLTAFASLAPSPHAE